jgi:multidrug transporter EmrE-like cation transporter
MLFIFIIILLSLAEYIGDSNFKLYARSGQLSHLGMGIVAYGVLISLFIKSLTRSNLIYANGMWDGVSAVITTALAFLLLGERLTNIQQWFGIVMIIGGIFALHVGKIPV